MNECQCGALVLDDHRCPVCGSTEFGRLDTPRPKDTSSHSKDVGPSLGEYRRELILEGMLDPFPERPYRNLNGPIRGSATAYVSEFRRINKDDFGHILYREYRGEPGQGRGEKGLVGDIKLASKPQGLLFTLQIRPAFYSEKRRMLSIDIGTPYVESHYSNVLASDPSRSNQGTPEQLAIYDQLRYSLQMQNWLYIDNVGLHWYSKRFFKALGESVSTKSEGVK